MNRRRHFILPLLSLLFATQSSTLLSGQEPVILGPETLSRTIGKNSECLIDEGKTLGIGDVSMSILDHEFTPSQEEILNFGYLNAAVWVRFFLQDSNSDRRWCLKVDVFDDVRVYFPEETGAWKEIVLGRKAPVSSVPKRGGYYYLDLPKTSAKTPIYLRYVHEDTMVIHLSVVDAQSSLMTGTEDYITAIYAGIIGVMVLYNLLLFLLLKDSSYVYYALYILFMLLLQLELAGMFLNTLDPASFIKTDMIETVVISLSLGFYIQFVRKFLMGKQFSPRLDKLLLILFLFVIAHIPTVFFVPFIARTLSLCLSLIVGMVMFSILVITCVRRGYAPVRFYILAWFILAASMISFVLRNFNLLPNILLTEFSMQIGTSIEAVLLAFGLAFRINLLQREREQAFASSKASRRMAEKMEADYRVLFETAPLGIALFDLEGNYLAVNHSYCDMYERREEELMGARFIDMVYHEDRLRAEKIFWENIIKNAAPGIISFERTNLTGSGKRIIVRYFLNFMKNEAGDPSGMLCCVEDITDLKRALDDLKHSLSEKELLLKEVHHRVKNNLQIIISLFRARSRDVQDPAFRSILDSTAGRIHAIANLHNRIYLSRDVEHVDCATFVESTVKQALGTFHLGDERLKLTLDIAPLELPVDMALPLSLIINELVSNGASHGQRKDTPLRLAIGFEATTGQEGGTGRGYKLSIEDDGAGFQENFSLENADSFGLNLVNSLVSQLCGMATLQTRPTTRFVITFPSR